MSLQIRHELYREEDLPESHVQLYLMIYLISLLRQLYIYENWYVGGNLEILPLKSGGPYAFLNLSPDVVLFKGAVLTPAEQQRLTSWNLNEPNRPPPTVVFEISSKGTWSVDLVEKPIWYGQLGAKEYFACDPQGVWGRTNSRLRGWRYTNGVPTELELDERGWLWSEELESWLEPDGVYLRLRTPDGALRLTGQEFEQAARFESERRIIAERNTRLKLEHQSETERAARLEAERRAEAERAAKEVERAAKEAERAAKEAALQEVQALREQLRRAGQNPDGFPPS